MKLSVIHLVACCNIVGKNTSIPVLQGLNSGLCILGGQFKVQTLLFKFVCNAKHVADGLLQRIPCLLSHRHAVTLLTYPLAGTTMLLHVLEPISKSCSNAAHHAFQTANKRKAWWLDLTIKNLHCTQQNSKKNTYNFTILVFNIFKFIRVQVTLGRYMHEETIKFLHACLCMHIHLCTLCIC